MSLTSEVQNPSSFTRKFIDQKFPHLQALSSQISKELKIYRDSSYPHYSDAYTYSLIGTATDYRIRFLYTRNAHRSATIESGLSMFRNLYSYWLNGKEHRNRLSNLAGGNKVRDNFYEQSKALLSASSEDQICRFCLLLAKVDHFRRGTTVFHFHETMKKGVLDLQELLVDCEESWIEDIKQLAAAYRLANENVLSKKLSVKHGWVLAGSADMPGGADLDLVIDRCLVEIKTTIKPKNLTNLLRQLLGYWLLDYDDELEIRSVRIDFVRQNHQAFLGEQILFGGLRSKKAVRAEFKAELRSQHS